ncbi:hypothetical protein SNE40_001583 [Patella caerulea]|uniref:HAT C-terminal dimerisation domain-containing protein n=1 Tax=Patella caerulea TaxID=87958 RepID=A0AAN8KHW9_PATCE
MEEMRAFLLSGTTKFEFGIQTDIQLSKYDIQARKKYTLLFNKIFQSALDKFEKHIDHHPAMNHYKSTRLFNPVYLPAQPKTLDAYPNIPEFSVHNQELLGKFNIYTHLRINTEDECDVNDFWESKKESFPLLFRVAKKAIWMPFASVDVEELFSLQNSSYRYM